MEACVIMLYPNFLQYVPFFIDLETIMLNNMCQNSTNCCDAFNYAQSLIENPDKNKIYNMSWDNIENCYFNNNLANMAEMIQFKQTMSLNPSLTSVPWITLQNMHNQTIQNDCETNTLQCVCNVYNGTNNIPCNQI